MSIRPAIPNFIDQIQFIKFYIFNSCDIKGMVYIESARPIVGEIAIAYLQFDLRSFVKTILRPKWGRAGRHTRRGPRGRRKGGGIPELNDLLADLLDPDDTLRPRYQRLGTTILLEIDDLVERVGYTMFLVDVVEGLVINSVLGAIFISEQDCPNITRMLRKEEIGTYGAIQGEWTGINMNDLYYINRVTSSAGFTAYIQQGECVVALSATIFKRLQPGRVALRIRTVGLTSKVLAQSPYFDLGQGESEQIVISARMPPNVTFTWEVHCSFGFLNVIDGQVMVMQIDE